MGEVVDKKRTKDWQNSVLKKGANLQNVALLVRVSGNFSEFLRQDDRNDVNVLVREYIPYISFISQLGRYSVFLGLVAEGYEPLTVLDEDGWSPLHWTCMAKPMPRCLLSHASSQ